MKRPTKIYTMLILFIFLSLSCNKEELFVEDLSQELIEEADENEEETSNEDVEEEQEAIDPTQPCEMSMETLIENMIDNSISVNCYLDLEGKTINMPANIKVIYEGGEIKNGTLVFAGGTIDGELLDISVKLQGEIQLSVPEYIFIPSKWNIVEGKTTTEIALQNRININEAIELVEYLNGNVFKIKELDAYFEVGVTGPNRKYCHDNSIRIPSNFHFEMSDSTYLRVQPTHLPAYALITTYTTDNSIISGGVLIGDRWEHDYTPFIDTSGVNRREHGWGHLVWIIGSHNTVIDELTIHNAIGEGIQVHAETIRSPDGSLASGKRTSENILIKNCLIKESRRNGIAIIDASGVVIDNCEIIDTGKGEQAYDADGNKIYSSSGALPKYGIDLEALRYINDDGSMNEINKIENVTIKNCRLKGNEFGDIDLFTCSDVIIENNYFDSMVANIAANNIIIRNNTFESRDSGNLNAINIKSYVRGGIEFNTDYEIYGNTIKGYGNAILMGGKNQKVTNNIIRECNTGIAFRHDLLDSSFSNNSIESNLQYSYGYKCNGSQNVSNISISNEQVNVEYRAISLVKLNSEVDQSNIQVTFKECSLKNTDKNFKLSINKSKNIEFKNNVSNTDFEIIDSENILLTNNVVEN